MSRTHYALLRAAADAATAANEEEQSPAVTDGVKMLCKVPILQRRSLGSPTCQLIVAQGAKRLMLKGRDEVGR